MKSRGGNIMTKRLFEICTLAVVTVSLCVAADVETVVHGTVTKVDQGAKTVVVKTADGTEHTIHFVGKTAVHGADATATGSKDAFKGVKEGSEVVAHYTVKGTEKTAVEVDKIGKDGLHATEGTITKVDHGAKTISVKIADGTEQTFKATEHGTEEAGKDVAKGTEKARRSPCTTPKKVARRSPTGSRGSNQTRRANTRLLECEPEGLAGDHCCSGARMGR
jgi:hypothetical protein